LRRQKGALANLCQVAEQVVFFEKIPWNQEKISMKKNGLLSLLLPLLLTLSGPAWAGAGAGLADLVENGGVILTRNGRIIHQENSERLFVPASVLKIGNALAALEILGRDYRFTTRCYLSPDGDLYLKGMADPMLISEEVAKIAANLKARGLTKIRNLHPDSSACRLENGVEGVNGTLNPYDAQNSCLAVNFNTISLIKGADGTVRSGEEQTPALSLMAELAQGLPPGSHRLNATAGGDRSLRYAGELFAAMLAKEGISLSGRIVPAVVPEGLPLFYEHLSGKSLDEVLSGLLKYSNNFIANQLFLAMGAKIHGWPATWDKGRRALTAFYQQRLGLGEKYLQVREGSGLSRENRVSPRAMLAILEAFKPYASLLPFENNCLRKSGTMTGVYGYAGYFQGEQGLDSFVLILNQSKNTRDQVLELLGAMHGRQMR